MSTVRSRSNQLNILVSLITSATWSSSSHCFWRVDAEISEAEVTVEQANADHSPVRQQKKSSCLLRFFTEQHSYTFDPGTSFIGLILRPLKAKKEDEEISKDADALSI